MCKAGNVLFQKIFRSLYWDNLLYYNITEHEKEYLQNKPIILTMKSVAMIINARWVVPVVPTNTVYDNYSIVVDNDRIIDILPTSV